MSLLPEHHSQETDGRSYRNMYWHNLRLRQRREKEAMVRKEEEERNDRRLQRPSVPQVAPGEQARTNTWTEESATTLWNELTKNVPEIDLSGSLSLRQFIRALDFGGPSIKRRINLPFPEAPVQSNAEGANAAANRSYVIKLWNLVSNQGQGKFDADSLRIYLVTPPVDPLTRVMATNARRPDLPSLNLTI